MSAPPPWTNSSAAPRAPALRGGSPATHAPAGAVRRRPGRRPLLRARAPGGDHPHLKWVTAPADVRACARPAAALLARFAPLVRPGGRLVYATCSLCRDRKRGGPQPFLGAHPGFAPAPLAAHLPRGTPRPGAPLLARRARRRRLFRRLVAERPGCSGLIFPLPPFSRRQI